MGNGLGRSPINAYPVKRRHNPATIDYGFASNMQTGSCMRHDHQKISATGKPMDCHAGSVFGIPDSPCAAPICARRRQRWRLSQDRLRHSPHTGPAAAMTAPAA
ncbi:MAG: hypothetical protein H6R22_386, partial [Chromatiaceae bacterium]|nr:hypothetical protein [Chromatiaceae bacterium]